LKQRSGQTAFIVLEKYYEELNEIEGFVFEDDSIEYSDNYNDDDYE
jgi:hypothetical protein